MRLGRRSGTLELACVTGLPPCDRYHGTPLGAQALMTSSDSGVGKQVELTRAPYAVDVVRRHPQELIGFLAQLLHSLTKFPKPLKLGVSCHRHWKPVQTNGHEKKNVRQRPT